MFPGPAQLFIAINMEKRGEPGIFSHVSMALSRFSVLIATEGWVGPGNEATTEPHCLFVKKKKTIGADPQHWIQV